MRALYRSQVALFQNKEKAIEYAVNVLKLDKDYATFVYEFAYEGRIRGTNKNHSRYACWGPGIHHADRGQVHERPSEHLSKGA